MKRKQKTESTVNILILGAFPPEITPLRRALRGNRGTAFGLTGIGPINAAVAVSKYLAEYRPRHVVFVGSVGAVSTKTKLLSVISAKSASMIDPCELLGKTETLAVGYPIIGADRRWLKRMTKLTPELIHAGVYTTVGLTRSKSLANKIGKDSRGEFESLELYGLAAACKAAGIPWNSIQVVTNHLGPNGHTEWKRNYKKAAEITAKLVPSLV